jgi:hypothetical protein
MLGDVKLKAIQAQIRADLLATPRGHMPTSIASVDESIAQWTKSLIFKEILDFAPEPDVLWVTDDTPRTWLGYTLGGVGVSGDNPDAIYRCAALDGRGTYEMVGRFRREMRAAQIVVQIDPGHLAKPSLVMTPTANPGKTFSHVALLTDGDLPVQTDGTFRITFGPEAGGPHHYQMPSGRIILGTRDLLSDWRQKPCDYAIRRLDGHSAGTFDEALFQESIYADLPNYVRFWSHFPDIWLKGLKTNQRSDVVMRAGGWGCQVGMCYDLAEDDAMLVRAGPSDAAFTGFQVMNPWQIAPNARKFQCSLNKSQVHYNLDKSITYVIANQDPGVANWLDTAGWPQGFGLMRWQGLPAGSKTDGLIQDFRVVKLSELSGLADIPRVSLAERRTQMAAREIDYTSRTR